MPATIHGTTTFQGGATSLSPGLPARGIATDSPEYVAITKDFPADPAVTIGPATAPDIQVHIAAWTDHFGNYEICGIGLTGSDMNKLTCQC